MISASLTGFIDLILSKVAGNHGRAVGRTISGRGKPFSKIPVFWSARKFNQNLIRIILFIATYHGYTEGQQLRYCGYGAKFEDVIIKGEPADLKVRLFPTILLSQCAQFLVNSQVHRILCQGRKDRCCSQVSARQTLNSLHKTHLFVPSETL